LKETSVRGEKRLGAIGLGLFFLFPLVGLFQLGDADGTWRQVAERARPSVLTVHEVSAPSGEANTATACAVVLCPAPLRAAIAGTAPAGGLRSPTAAGWIAWKTIYTDPDGAFSLLEARAPLPSASPRHASLFAAGRNAPGAGPLAAAVLPALRAEEDDSQPVPAVLVSPAPLDELPLWVGVLESEHDAGGRALYRGTRLRELAAVDAQAGAAHASAANIHPALRGAPFVTREGVVVALYAGSDTGAAQAVPIGRVRQVLSSLGAGGAR
jgi:hypothetical protein